MNELIKSRTKLCLLAAIAGAVLFATPLPTVAREREGVKPTDTGPTKGEVPPTKVRSREFEALQARGRAAAAKLDFNDPKAVKQVNAQLAKVRVDLAAYAKANGLKLTRKEHTHKAAGQGFQSCANWPGCVLTGAWVGKDGVLHCEYDCVPRPTEVKQ